MDKKPRNEETLRRGKTRAARNANRQLKSVFNRLRSRQLITTKTEFRRMLRNQRTELVTEGDGMVERINYEISQREAARSAYGAFAI